MRRFNCVASEGGAPFVARRAMNLHGCVPASLCPPFFLLRGYPRERISYGSGAPPSYGDSAGTFCYLDVWKNVSASHIQLAR